MKTVTRDMRKKANCSFLELVWPPGLHLQGKPDPGKWMVREEFYMKEHAQSSCQAKMYYFHFMNRLTAVKAYQRLEAKM